MRAIPTILAIAFLVSATTALAADPPLTNAEPAIPGAAESAVRLARVQHQARAPLEGAHATASSPYDTLWSDQFALPTPDSQVNAIISFGGSIIMAGYSNYWGTTTTSRIASWDGVSWHPLGDGLGPSLTVGGVLSLAAYGGQLIAGARGVFVWDGTTWNVLGSANGTVYALTVMGGDLYAAGDFTTIGGVAASHVARWDGANWNTVGGGLAGSNVPKALATHGTLLVAGGAMPGYQGIAAWNGTSWAQVGAGFQIGVQPATVNALASDGTTLYASGSFTSSGGVAITKVAAWNGSTWSGLPGATLSSNALAMYGGLLMATVPLASVGKPQLWSGSTWQDFGGPAIQPIAYGLDGSTLYTYGSRSTLSVGMDLSWSFNGSTWSKVQQPWTSNMKGIAGPAYAAREWNGALYVGGSFGWVGATNQFLNAISVAKWDGTAWQAMAGVSGQVFSFQPWNNSLVAAADGRARMWTGSGWTTLGTTISLWPFWLATYNGDLIALGNTGDESLPGGVARLVGSAWVPLGSGTVDPAGGDLQVGAQWGNSLAVGGSFASLDGVTARNCALWDGGAWHDIGGGVNGYVYTLASFGGDLVVGGEFTEVGGDSIPGVARWDGSHWSAMGTRAREVYGLKEHGGRLFAEGEFVDDLGGEIYTAAVWTGSDWLPLSSGTDAVGHIEALDFVGDDLYLIGGFGSIGGHASRGIARLPAVSALAVGPSHAGISLALASAPNPSRGPVGLTFTLPAAGRARVTIHDLAGRRVAMLADGDFTAGPHALSWGARVVPGLYFATLEAAGARRTARLVRIE